MALSRPLAVALVAAVLLVVVVGADASMDRSVHVDREEEDGAWVTLASAGEVPPEEHYRVHPDGGPARVEDRNGTVTLRVRVENGYPWGYAEDYVAYAQDVEVARGRLVAEPRSSGASEFEVPAQRIAGTMEPKPVPENATGRADTYFGMVEVRVGGRTLFASLRVEVTG